MSSKAGDLPCKLVFEIVVSKRFSTQPCSLCQLHVQLNTLDGAGLADWLNQCEVPVMILWQNQRKIRVWRQQQAGRALSVLLGSGQN